MVKRLSGSGDKGYIDGEPGLARFNKPKSFTVDLRGNVYVADQLNHAVRKISSSGAFNCRCLHQILDSMCLYIGRKVNYRCLFSSSVFLGMTTTIAGNYSQTGRQDGPGNTATFSSDFEVLFVPQLCALLISDHGNQLLRQVGLKQEDCIIGSQSGENLKHCAISYFRFC